MAVVALYECDDMSSVVTVDDWSHKKLSVMSANEMTGGGFVSRYAERKMSVGTCCQHILLRLAHIGRPPYMTTHCRPP